MEYEPHIMANLRSFRWGADLPKGDPRMVQANALHRLGLIHAIPESAPSGIVVAVTLTSLGRSTLGITGDDP